MDRVKRIWYLSPMRAAKVQASLRIRAVSPEPPLLAHTSNESRGTLRQKARSLAALNGWACAVKMCHDGMLEDTNSLDSAQMYFIGLFLHATFRGCSLIYFIRSSFLCSERARSAEWCSFGMFGWVPARISKWKVLWNMIDIISNINFLLRKDSISSCPVAKKLLIKHPPIWSEFSLCGQ